MRRLFMILTMLSLAAAAYGQVESGSYLYDPSGNITAIGPDVFFYDKMGRLKQATVRTVTESYDYDEFGNRRTPTGALNCVESCAQSVSIQPSTNRLSNSGVAYDAAGNMTTGVGGESYSYDGTGMMTHATAGSDDREFIYTADDERIAVKQGLSWTWTVRDQGGKVLREFSSASLSSSTPLTQTNRQWQKDYVWRSEGLVATVSPNGTYHYHLDHLGTPRLVTDVNRTTIGEHAYYPFGPEINLTPHETPETRMKFTGHERDAVAGGAPLDYMHARYYSPAQGRFLSVDPVLAAEKAVREPQRWNRYTYVLNNPIKLIDPTGKVVEIDANADVRRLKVFLTETMRRPTGRADVMAVINDPNHKLRVTSGTLTPEAQIQMNLRNHGSASIEFGRTVPTGNVQLQPNGTGQFVVNGSTMTIDLNATSRHHPDRSGVTTTAHEFDHVNDLRAGGVAQMQQGDVPTRATGSAERHGQAVAAERPDLTAAQARALVDQLIQVKP